MGGYDVPFSRFNSSFFTCSGVSCVVFGAYVLVGGVTGRVEELASAMVDERKERSAHGDSYVVTNETRSLHSRVMLSHNPPVNSGPIRALHHDLRCHFRVSVQLSLYLRTSAHFL